MSIYAVNGKEPIAAWIPSLDDAGNGTTTLTDLVPPGSYPGTLTNMDAATDWVTDTDAGGVRALDFDGVNDFVQTSAFSNLPSSNFSLTFWCKLPNNGAERILFATGANLTSPGLLVRAISGQYKIRAGVVTNGSNYRLADTGTLTTVWNFLCFVFDGSSTIYLNSVVGSQLNQGTLSNTTNLNLRIGAFAGIVGGGWCDGLLDDIRIWDVALDATDVAALYAGGLGRGITFGGVDKWSLLRRGNRMGHIGVMSSPNQHIARGIRMAQMGITL